MKGALALHEERTLVPSHEEHYVSVMCGVSGDALAFRAMGGKEENMHFYEICDEHQKTLRAVFPKAHIHAEGDIMKEETQRSILELKKLSGAPRSCIEPLEVQNIGKAVEKHA